MTRPLVSVIIPCYRQARYLPGAIDSAVNQSYPAIEIILVNDGSDDDTEAVAQRYAAQVRYIRQANGGSSSARNAGIRAARGKYLLFLDADDLLHPEAVSWLVEAMQDQEDRVCVMGYRKFRIDPAQEVGNDYLPPAEQPLVRRVMFECLAPPHGHLCSKTLALRIGGFDDSWTNGCEDWDFWQRLALAGATFVAVPRVGAYYRRYDGSVSTNWLRMDMMQAAILLRAQREFGARPDLLRQWGYTPEETQRRFKALVQEFMLGAAYRLGKVGEFRRSLVYYIGSIYRGGWSSTAVLGLAKLLPNFLVWHGQHLLGSKGSA
jgi:glycosyltransferase involved in cell wall biosynthesis